MHVQILEIDKRLKARCVANAPHFWAMCIWQTEKPKVRAELTKRLDVKRPGIRAWGQNHSRVIGSTGGECGQLRRRHSERPCRARAPARRSLLRHACVKRCKGGPESVRCGRK